MLLMICHVIIKKMSWIHANLLVDFKHDFKDVIINELHDFHPHTHKYMDEKLKMFSADLNYRVEIFYL